MTLLEEFLAREEVRKERESAAYVAAIEAELARRRWVDAERGRLFEEAMVSVEALRAAGVIDRTERRGKVIT